MAVLLVAVVFAALLAGGGYADNTGLLAAFAAMVCLFTQSFTPAGRRAFAAARSPMIPATLFALVIIVALLQLLQPHVLDREYPWVQLLRLLGGGAMFLAAVAVGRSAHSIKRLGIAMTAASLAFVVFSLALHLSVPHDPDSRDTGRLMATFPTSPNTAAAALGLIALIALGALLQKARRIPIDIPMLARVERLLGAAWLEAIALGLATASLGLTGSRSGLALVLLCAVLLIAWNAIDAARRNSGGTGGGWAAVLGFIAVALIGGGVTFARLPTAQADAVGRMMIYRAHWPHLFDQPLLGHGFGSFVIVNRSAVTQQNFQALTWIGDMHSVYMQWIEQAGWLGSAAMFGCIGWCLVVIVRGAGRAEASRTWMKTVAAASLFLLLQGLVEIALQYEGMVLLWALLLGSAYGAATANAHHKVAKASERLSA